MNKTFNAAKRFNAGQLYTATTVALLAPMLVTAGPWWRLCLLEVVAIMLLTAEARWGLLRGLHAAQRWAWRVSVMAATLLLAGVPLGLPATGLLWGAGVAAALAAATGGVRLLLRALSRLLVALAAQGHHRLYWLVLVMNGAVAAAFSATFALGAAADWQAGSLGALPWAARALLVLVLVRTALLHRLRQAPEYGGVRQPLRYPAGRLVPAAAFFTVIVTVQHLGLAAPTAKVVFMTVSATFAAAQVVIDHFQPTSLSPKPAPAPEIEPEPVRAGTPSGRLSVSLSAVLAAVIVFDQVRKHHRPRLNR